jgi:hypothetical protein
MTQYHHAYDIAFAVESNDEDAKDVTPAMMKAALLKRIEDVFDNSGEWMEACDWWDTYEVPE